ncbi:MAG: CHASE2 domain-containing protein [Opitutaceae bacterium]
MKRGLLVPARLLSCFLSILTGTLAVALLFFSPAWSFLTRSSFDLQTTARLHEAGPSDVVLVLMDERSHEDLDQSRIDAWDTALHAGLVERLSKDGAALVIFDVCFSPRIESAGDAKFRSQSVREDSETPVLFAAVAEVTFPKLDAVLAVGSARPAGIAVKPPRFASPRHDNWGLVNLWGAGIDPDFAIRRAPGVVPPGSGLDPILDVRRLEHIAAERWHEQRGASDAGCPPAPGAWIRYRTNPGGFQSVSFVDVWNGGMPHGFFRDKVVFVGGSEPIGFTGSAKDLYAAPFAARGGSTGMMGLELVAHLFESHRRCDWLRPLPRWSEFAAGIGSACFLGVFFVLVPLRAIPLIAIAAMAGGFLFLPAMADALSIVCNWMAVPLALVPVTVATAGTWQLFSEHRQKRLLQRELEKYFPPPVAGTIVREQKLDPQLREATVLMTDLAAFTTLAHEMNPVELIDILHKYFNDVVGAIFAHGGTVVSYIGDAVLAVWGVPLPDEKASANAMAAAAEAIRKTCRKKYYGHLLKTRIGITRGRVLAGNIGADDRVNYAITGDCVNLSSRLEGLSKHLGTTVLFSEDVRRSLVSDTLPHRFVGNFVVAGKERPMGVYQLFTDMDAKIDKADLDRVAAGLEHFARGEGERALKCFQEAHVAAADPVAAFYARWISEFGVEACSARGIAVSK